MLEFLNEVLMIEDLEPDAYQMGISGKSGAKNKAPDGGKASIKGDFNALHPRYPAGHPQGGKFMPKGSKDQIKAISKNTGQSVEKVAAAVGGKAPANKGKLTKFSGSAGAVGKAQKVLKNKESTPEQRAKAKASIAKAAGKMRGDAPAIAGKAKAVPTGSMTSTKAPKKAPKKLIKERQVRKSGLLSDALEKRFDTSDPKAARKAGKIASNVLESESQRYKSVDYRQRGIDNNKKAIAKSIARNAKKKDKQASKNAGKPSLAERKSSLLSNALERRFNTSDPKSRTAGKIASNVLESESQRYKSVDYRQRGIDNNKKAIAKSIARNAKKKAKR